MDSDEETEETNFSWQGTSGCIILINCFDPNSHNTATVAYEATCEMVRSNMRKSNSGLIGLCLYGTKDTPTSGMALPNMVQIMPLAIPTLENFQNMLSQQISDFGQASEFKISDILWHCSKMFKQCNKRLSNRTVIMLTRLDLPPTNLDATKRHQTLKRVMDLVHLGININLINVSMDEYEVHPFYKEMLKATSKGNDDLSLPKHVWHCEDICHSMQQHSHRHLALAKINFEIGDGVSIGVGLYKLIQPCPKPKTVTLSNSTNEVLTKYNRTMKVSMDLNNTPSDIAGSSDDLQLKEVPLLKSETLYYQIYGGERVEFTQNEMDKINFPFPPRMLKLLGFKPQSVLRKDKWYLKQCAFLFPNESLIEGSTVAFKALHSACLTTGMVPICVLCTRANSKPKIVALSPCTRPLGLEIDIGFDIIFLPFLENVKDIPNFEDNEDNFVSAHQKGFMKDMLTTLNFDFKSDMFENPVLECMYSAIEALALNEEETRPFVDSTKLEPGKYDNIDSQSFEQLFGPFGVSATKRPTTSKGDGPIAKRGHQPVEIDEELLKSRVSMGQVNKYTVSELKDILNWKKPANLPALTGLRKDKLVDLVQSHIRFD